MRLHGVNLFKVDIPTLRKMNLMLTYHVDTAHIVIRGNKNTATTDAYQCATYEVIRDVRL